MSNLGDATIELFDALFLEAGYTVDVSRGGGSAVQVPVLRGRAFTERFGDDGYGVSHEDDFIVKLDEYKTLVGGEPDRFDTIVWTDDNGLARSFRVGRDGQENDWDPSAQFGTLARIHTTEV